ncbi:hypothetical protein GCM10010912_12890 [Paenibacillus albidus]|uniref:Uncharacterized protein n=1 Tax=Paenibacillus albidus TaxID=2041023 RepID=A0A917C468_9BACL|nr:hypothetical protein GCM10010912_12890 [Paenibacillus albidus]
MGANRYRDPDKDLPADFEERREENYKALKHPLDAEAFITTLKQAMSEGLEKLNAGMPKNPKVALQKKRAVGSEFHLWSPKRSR